MVDFDYGYIAGKKIYRKGIFSLPDREIGDVRGTEDETISFFQARFKLVELKMAEIENQIAGSVNKGSFLVKLKHFRKSLYEFDGLGDFVQIINKLNVLEEYLNGLIKHNQNKNLDAKLVLLDELNLIKDHYNLKEASQKVKNIKDQWIKTGMVPEDLREEIESTFIRYLDYFYERKKSFVDDRNKMIADYIARYRNIIEEAKLVAKAHTSRSYNRISELKTEWNKLPKLPVNIIKPLWSEFSELIKNNLDQQTKIIPPEPDLNEILNEKERIIKVLQNISINFKIGDPELKSLRNSWDMLPVVFNSRNRILDKTAMDLFNKLFELDFIMKLASKKKKNFRLLEKDQQIGLLVEILKDMVDRDKKDYEIANNNFGIIHSDDEKMQKILQNQLENKIKRITVKTDLLNDLSTGKILIFNGKI